VPPQPTCTNSMKELCAGTPYGYHENSSCKTIKAHALIWPEEGLSWFASRNWAWKPCGQCDKKAAGSGQCQTDAAGSGQCHTDAAGSSSAGSSSCTPKKKGKTTDQLRKWYDSGSKTEGGCTDLMAPHTEGGSTAENMNPIVDDPCTEGGSMADPIVDDDPWADH